MPGIAELALGAAPIAGGALLGAAAGSFKGPDVRAMILKDMDLLERIPDDQPELKARLKASIDDRIDDLIAATEKSRAIREAAVSYSGNWRDIVVFICAILFTIIWWNVSHSRSQLAHHVHLDDHRVGGRRDLRGPRLGARNLQFHAQKRSRRGTAEISVVVGVRRRRDVRRVVDVVELRRLDAVRAGQVEDLVGAGDTRQV